MDLPDFLTRWLNGEIVLRAHRIGFYFGPHNVGEGQGGGSGREPSICAPCGFQSLAPDHPP